MRYLLGNWKMNMSLSQIDKFTDGIEQLKPNIFVGVAVPSIYYAYCYKLKQKMSVGLQNVSEYVSGAYTGEISAGMLEDVQADFCLVGHSERRQYFGETDARVNSKLKMLLSKNILPVLCVGETLEQYEANETRKVLNEQLTQGLAGITATDDFVIAYEPVWAIGTGKTATETEIDSTCGYIKEIVKQILGKANIAVLYGGSVKSTNSAGIVNLPNVDGALVGGASQNADEFIKILNTFK